MGSLSDASSLAIATLDLSLVQLVTQAIRTADIGAAASAGIGTMAATDTSARRGGLQYGDVSKPGLRYSDHPAATFEKCSTYHCHPRYQELQPYNCPHPVQPVDKTPAIQPPWKTLAWPTHHRPILPPGHRVIKVQPNNTDVSNVGRTLDLFI